MPAEHTAPATRIVNAGDLRPGDVIAVNGTTVTIHAVHRITSPNRRGYNWQLVTDAGTATCRYAANFERVARGTR